MRPAGEPPTASAGGFLSGDAAARVSTRAVAGVPWDGGAWAMPVGMGGAVMCRRWFILLVDGELFFQLGDGELASWSAIWIPRRHYQSHVLNCAGVNQQEGHQESSGVFWGAGLLVITNNKREIYQ